MSRKGSLVDVCLEIKKKELLTKFIKYNFEKKVKIVFKGLSLKVDFIFLTKSKFYLRKNLQIASRQLELILL